MKTRILFLIIILVALAVPITQAQRQHAARPNTPRANQGHVPPPPPPVSRTHPAPPPVEHDGNGRVNGTPHVNHDHWYGHDSPNDPRYRTVRPPVQRGRFTRFGPSYRYDILRIDRGLHRFWLPGGFFFQIALWDWPLCEDWCWDCDDDFVIYEDPDHPGWYLLYNVHTGQYVHAEYLGL